LMETQGSASLQDDPPSLSAYAGNYIEHETTEIKLLARNTVVKREMSSQNP